jgi:hypothetical protein
MFSEMWLPLQKYGGGARAAVQRMHGRGWSAGIPFSNAGVPPYTQVTRSKTYCSYVKLWIMPNAIYNVIFV